MLISLEEIYKSLPDFTGCEGRVHLESNPTELTKGKKKKDRKLEKLKLRSRHYTTLLAFQAKSKDTDEQFDPKTYVIMSKAKIIIKAKLVTPSDSSRICSSFPRETIHHYTK